MGAGVSVDVSVDAGGGAARASGEQNRQTRMSPTTAALVAKLLGAPGPAADGIAPFARGWARSEEEARALTVEDLVRKFWVGADGVPASLLCEETVTELGNEGPDGAHRQWDALCDWEYTVPGDAIDSAEHNSAPFTLATPAEIVQSTLATEADMGPAVEPQLFGEHVRPFDVVQSELNDCYLLAAASAVAQYPDLMRSLFLQQRLTSQHFYAVRFWQFNRWVCAIVTDAMLCKRTPHQTKLTLKYARNAVSNEFWVALLEKAYAFLYGRSFAKIEGGNISEGLRDLTGCAVTEVRLQDLDTGELKPTGSTRSSSSKDTGETESPVHERDAWDDLYRRWVSAQDGVGVCLSCARWTSDGDEDGTTATATATARRRKRVGAGRGKQGPQLRGVLLSGVRTNHAYGIVGMREVDNHRLLIVRNPWGAWTNDDTHHTGSISPRLNDDGAGATLSGADTAASPSVISSKTSHRDPTVPVHLLDEDQNGDGDGAKDGAGGSRGDMSPRSGHNGCQTISWGTMCRSFNRIYVCTLGTDVSPSNRFAVGVTGRWTQGVSAGGCNEFVSWRFNPCYQLRLESATGEVSGGRQELLSVSLSTRDRRACRTKARNVNGRSGAEGGLSAHYGRLEYPPVGFCLVHMHEGCEEEPLLRSSSGHANHDVVHRSAFVNARDVCDEVRLPVAMLRSLRLRVVPSSYMPDLDAEFYLSVARLQTTERRAKVQAQAQIQDSQVQRLSLEPCVTTRYQVTRGPICEWSAAKRTAVGAPSGTSASDVARNPAFLLTSQGSHNGAAEEEDTPMVVEVEEEDAAQAGQEVGVIITVRQWPLTDIPAPDAVERPSRQRVVESRNVPIGCFVFRNRDAHRAFLHEPQLVSDDAFLGGAFTFTNSSEVERRVVLTATQLAVGVVLMPCTHRPGMEAAFQVSVASLSRGSPLHLQRLDLTKERKAPRPAVAPGALVGPVKSGDAATTKVRTEISGAGTTTTTKETTTVTKRVGNKIITTVTTKTTTHTRGRGGRGGRCPAGGRARGRGQGQRGGGRGGSSRAGGGRGGVTMQHMERAHKQQADLSDMYANL